jgi:hypothetical protein
VRRRIGGTEEANCDKGGWRAAGCARLAVEIGLHVCYEEAGFGAAEGMAPVVDFVNGLDINARGIGGRKGEHGE